MARDRCPVVSAGGDCGAVDGGCCDQGAAAEITVVLRHGRQLRCPGRIEAAALTRLVRLLETA